MTEETQNNPTSININTDEKTMAIAAHLGGLFTSAVAPFVVWNLQKKNPENTFSTEHALEALNFQLTILIGFVAGMILSAIVIGVFISLAVVVADIWFSLQATKAASEMQPYKYPFSIKVIS